MKIQFLGAAQEVTGSKHLITTDEGVRILLDCGMYQGKGKETDSRNRELGFQPSDTTHATSLVSSCSTSKITKLTKRAIQCRCIVDSIGSI